MEKINVNVILISKKTFVINIIAAMLLGMALCYLLNNKTPQILYVSEEEILTLENERISDAKYETRELFFGKPKEASELIIKFANNLKAQNSFVIFSKGKVFGDNVRSMAEEIHSNVVETMEKNQ